MDNVFNAPNATPVAGTANSPVAATNDSDDDLATVNAFNTPPAATLATPPLDDTAAKTPDKPADESIKFESWDNDADNAGTDKVGAAADLAEGNDNPLGETGINDTTSDSGEFADEEDAPMPKIDETTTDSTPISTSTGGSIDELEKELTTKKTAMDGEIAKIEENKKKIDDALAKIASLKSQEEEIRQIVSGI